MTAFLIAALLALVAGGGLVVVWREHRALFPRALTGTLLTALLVAAYGWWASHGYSVAGDDHAVHLDDLTLQRVADSYRLAGQARNTRADVAVSAVQVRLRVEYCVDAACAAHLDLERPLVISLPPAEVRRFSLAFPASGSVPPGELRWQATAGAARTYRPAVR